MALLFHLNLVRLKRQLSRFPIYFTHALSGLRQVLSSRSKQQKPMRRPDEDSSNSLRSKLSSFVKQLSSFCKQLTPLTLSLSAPLKQKTLFLLSVDTSMSCFIEFCCLLLLLASVAFLLLLASMTSSVTCF